MKIEAMQLNIFGETKVLDAEENASKKKEPQKTSGGNNKKAKVQKTMTPVNTTGEELPPDRDRLVCYAGHQILITDRSLTLEQIRQQLERDFPELSAERVVWHWIKPEDEEVKAEDGQGTSPEAVSESQNENPEQQKKPVILVPVVTAGKKGLGKISQALRGYHRSVKEMMADPRPIHVLAARNGVYEVRKTPVGLFSRKISEKPEEVCGPDSWQEGVILNYPKIPVAVLYEVLKIFRSFCPYEVMAYICWEKDHYCIVLPEQEVSKENIAYQKITPLIFEPGKLPVLELHSHGRGKAFFSVTDDMDEVATGLYGVLGRVDTDKPEMLLRYSCGGVYKNIPPKQVFEGHFWPREGF